jgi:hypothetical protein
VHLVPPALDPIRRAERSFLMPAQPWRLLLCRPLRAEGAKLPPLPEHAREITYPAPGFHKATDLIPLLPIPSRASRNTRPLHQRKSRRLRKILTDAGVPGRIQRPPDPGTPFVLDSRRDRDGHFSAGPSRGKEDNPVRHAMPSIAIRLQRTLGNQLPWCR